jgi:hypothetical protein
MTASRRPRRVEALAAGAVALVAFQAKDYVTFADARGMADAVMRPADGQGDEKDLTAADA